MSILGQMYRNIAVHCFEGETLFICFGHFVAEHHWSEGYSANEKNYAERGQVDFSTRFFLDLEARS